MSLAYAKTYIVKKKIPLCLKNKKTNKGESLSVKVRAP